MLSSGSNSYYDDYSRKRGSSRVIHDPPSLLTDRGAYVNFLEVQLERVSAACLGVQAHDQRFHDMHEVMALMEDKVSTAMRLVGLAQQCTEEVRMEVEGKINMVKKMAVQEHNEMLTSLQTITERVSNIEKSLNTTLNSLLPRVDQLEHRLTQQAQEYEKVTLRHEHETNELRVHISSLEANYSHSSRTIVSLQAHIDKIEGHQHAYESNMEAKIEAIERRFIESVCQTQDNVYHRIDENQHKTSAITSQLMNDLITKESHLKQKIQEQYDVFHDKTSMIEGSIYDQDKRVHQTIRELDESLSHKIQNKHDILENMITIQEGLKIAAENLEHESRQQFYAIDDEIQSIHELISRNNTIIVDKIIEKEEHDDNNFEAYGDELSMIKDVLNHVQDNITAIDQQQQQQSSAELEPLVRSQVRDILLNEMTIAKSFSGIMNMSSHSKSNNRSRSSYHRNQKSRDVLSSSSSRRHHKHHILSSRRYEPPIASDDLLNILSGDDGDSYDSSNSSDSGDETSTISSIKRYDRQGRLRITKDLCASDRHALPDSLSPIRPKTSRHKSSSSSAAASQSNYLPTTAPVTAPKDISAPAEAISSSTQPSQVSRTQSSQPDQPQASQQRAVDIDLKEVLANFLDVYLVDQRAIRERLNELTDHNQQQQDILTARSNDKDERRQAKQSDAGDSDVEHAHDDEDEVEEEDMIHDRDYRIQKRPTSRKASSQYYSDSEMIVSATNPLLGKKSATAYNASSSQRQDDKKQHRSSSQSRSSYHSTSSGDESERSRSRKAPVPRQHTSAPIHMDSKIPIYVKSPSSARELSSKLHRQHHRQSSTHDATASNSSFEFDDVYDENKDHDNSSPYASPSRDHPAESSSDSHIISPFFSRIPRSTRSSNPPTPNRSMSPSSIPPPPISVSPRTMLMHLPLTHSREYTKDSPFSNPLSRKPKVVAKIKKSKPVDAGNSPGSDTSTITSTTTTSSSFASLVPAGMHYPQGSLGTHLSGAAAKVKPNAPTRIL